MNNVYINLKDIRLYINCFEKQNLNFLEILFTKFKIVNPQYAKWWDVLVEHREEKRHAPSGIVVSGRVVAVTGVAAADYHSVGTALESTKHKERVYAAGAGNADDLDIRGVLKPVRSGEIGTGVGAPVATERDDLRLEFVFIHRHIASTSARICLLEKPERSIAPDGQATVQAPQPWQPAGLTWATRRSSVVRLGPRNSL